MAAEVTGRASDEGDGACQASGRRRLFDEVAHALTSSPQNSPVPRKAPAWAASAVRKSTRRIFPGTVLA
jgi:hypothetical protein